MAATVFTSTSLPLMISVENISRILFPLSPESFASSSVDSCQWDYYLFDQRCHNPTLEHLDAFKQDPTGKRFLKFDQEELRIINICMIVSSMFLLLSLAIYWIVKELQTVPGKCLMGLIFSEFITNCCIMVMFRLNKNGSYGQERTWLCLVVGVVGHYFFLTIMSWSNVIAFDMFRKLNHPTRKLRNFTPYIYFAYLTPLFVILLTIGLDFTISDLSPLCALRPQYGLRMCGLSTSLSKLVFVTLPLCLSLLLSFAVLLVTIYKLRAVIKELSLSKIPKSVWDRMILYGKLFILLGIFFLFGLMGVLLSCWHTLNFVSLIISSLHGTCIFVVFTCKRSVLGLLARHLREWRNPGAMLTTTINSCQNRISLQNYSYKNAGSISNRSSNQTKSPTPPSPAPAAAPTLGHLV